MKESIGEFFQKLMKSFDNQEDGLSARKLTAFAIMVLIIIAHVKWLNSCYKNNEFNLLPEILMIDYGAILTLLGLTTWERVKKSEHASKDPKEQKKS